MFIEHTVWTQGYQVRQEGFPHRKNSLVQAGALGIGSTKAILLLSDMSQPFLSEKYFCLPCLVVIPSGFRASLTNTDYFFFSRKFKGKEEN